MTDTPQRDPGRYKLWEKILLSAAFLLFSGSTFVYLSGIPLRIHLFGWEEELKELEGVGFLEFSLGDIKRKKFTSPLFERIRQQDRLYNFDTIVTGPDGGATLTLDDGSNIDLGPNTMIRLEFASRLTLGGVSRGAQVSVVAGQVTGKLNPVSGRDLLIKSNTDLVRLSKGTGLTSSIKVAAPGLKPMRPSDRNDVMDEAARLAAMSEDERKVFMRLQQMKDEKDKLVRLRQDKYGVRLVSPAQDDVLALPDGTKELVRRTRFEWEVNPPDAEVRFTRRRLSELAEKGTFMELLTRVVPGEGGKGFIDIDLELPGRYEWELAGVEERIETERRLWNRFTVDPTFRGIDVGEPLIGGAPARSNEYAGASIADFDITLVWDPFPRATYYQVDVYKDPTTRVPVLERRVAETKYAINKDKVFSGRIYYRVSTELRNGFVATSGMVTFRFDFLPPVAMIPKENARITQKDIAAEGGKILFTWQKTNYTEAYELQVATDPAFANTIARQKTEENFALMKSPPPGTYYWRLRSLGKGASSPPGPWRPFMVTP
ncbi:MAG: FecR domain-containing protein [Bdellovibrionales bacterium]|nr:FecR domain-containing protein [Bdellovibrionales bacterium]